MKTVQTNLQTTSSSEFVRLRRRFFDDYLCVQTNKSTKVRLKFTLRRALIKTNKSSIFPFWRNETSKGNDGFTTVTSNNTSGVYRFEFTLVEQTVRRFVRPDDHCSSSNVNTEIRVVPVVGSRPIAEVRQ